MDALTTLFPVFFMLALGFISKLKGWITPEQKAGANSIVFNILFPILVFNLLASASIEFNHIFIILYVFVMYSLAIVVGKLTGTFVSKQYKHLVPYLLCVVEGGNVALPLYLSIVGQSSNTVIFDIAGTIVCFVVAPILIAKESSNGTTGKELVKNIVSNSFVKAVILGLLLNFTGLYQMIIQSPFGDMYTATLSQATVAIVPMILFILGYDLKIDKKTLAPILKLMSIKTLYYAIVIVGFFILFPTYMADKTFMMAPIIYFMAPTGFGLLPIITPLFKDEEDAEFTSAFMSIYILVTLVVYTCVVLYIA